MALPPAACSGSLRSCGGNGQFSLPCVLEGEAAEQRQLSFTSTLMFSWETEYWYGWSLRSSSACRYLKGRTKHLRHQEISSLKPSSGLCRRIHAELYFSAFRLSMLCVLQIQPEPWMHRRCRTAEKSLSPVSPEDTTADPDTLQSAEMQGNSLRTVFNLSLWICSKPQWNKRRDYCWWGTGDCWREDLEK